MNTIRIAVTGAAGQIGYSLLPRIAAGEMFGSDAKVTLQLLEIPPAMGTLEGVVMELDDCAFDLVREIHTTDNPNKAFEDVDFALLVGSKPRGPGMERKDLLEANAAIFSVQGEALNENSSQDVKVLVVGNPANTNCLIAQRNAARIPPEQFTAMTRLDHNRARGLLASKFNSHVSEVTGLTIWGNHSSTQYPDISNALVSGKSIWDSVDKKWLDSEFIPRVQQRGAEIIEARGSSSAASAANAAIEHMKSWNQGTDGQIVSMAVHSDGSYGIEPGLIYSFPCVCEAGKWEIVQGLEIDTYGQEKMRLTEAELIEERDAVAHLLPS